MLHNLCSVVHKMPFISKYFLLQILLFFINSVLKFKYQPGRFKVKHTNISVLCKILYVLPKCPKYQSEGNNLEWSKLKSQ